MQIGGRASGILAQKRVSSVWTIDPNATVIAAIRLMDEKNVGALLVVDNGRLVGIVSERDYTRKVSWWHRPARPTGRITFRSVPFELENLFPSFL